MNVLLDTKSAKVWIDEYAPIMFSRWMIVPDKKKSFHELCESNIQAVNLIKKRKQLVVYSVCDASEMAPFHFEMFVKHYLTSLADQFPTGLHFMAIVKPADVPTGWSIADFTKEMKIRIDSFDCFSKALNSVNKMLETLTQEA